MCVFTLWSKCYLRHLWSRPLIDRINTLSSITQYNHASFRFRKAKVIIYPSISFSIFFLRSSMASGVSIPAGILLSPLGVTRPSVGVTSPVSSGACLSLSSSSSSSSLSSSDSDSSSPQRVRSMLMSSPAS